MFSLLTSLFLVPTNLHTLGWQAWSKSRFKLWNKYALKLPIFCASKYTNTLHIMVAAYGQGYSGP